MKGRGWLEPAQGGAVTIMWCWLLATLHTAAVPAHTSAIPALDVPEAEHTGAARMHVPLLSGAMPPFGSTWLRSDSLLVNLTVLPVSSEFWTGDTMALRWTQPKKPSVLMTALPVALPTRAAGDAAVVRFRWRSDGDNKCDPSDWADNRTCTCGQKLKETCEPDKGTPTCARTSVNCIEGTGDFRIAVWDTTR